MGFSDPPLDEGNDLRPGLTINVRVVPEAASIAQTMGWENGVPGTEVRVHRIGTDFAWETAVTDDQGTAYLPRLVSGRYRVAAFRPLTDEEAAESGVAALASGRILSVAPGGTEHTVELTPNRSGALVISEVYAPATPSRTGLSYNFHMYFELYNSSDRTLLRQQAHLSSHRYNSQSLPARGYLDEIVHSHELDTESVSPFAQHIVWSDVVRAEARRQYDGVAEISNNQRISDNPA